jgi:hypothetical protein
MHLVLKHVRGFLYELVFELQEMLCIKGHLGSQTPSEGDPIHMDILFINILLDNPIHLLFIGKRWVGPSNEYRNGGRGLSIY